MAKEKSLKEKTLKFLIAMMVAMIAALTASIILTVIDRNADAAYVRGNDVRAEAVFIILIRETGKDAPYQIKRTVFSEHAYFSNVRASRDKKSGICHLRVHRNSQYDHLRPRESVPEAIKDAIKEIASIIGGVVSSEPVITMKKEKSPPPAKNDWIKKTSADAKTRRPLAGNRTFLFKTVLFLIQLGNWISK